MKNRTVYVGFIFTVISLLFITTQNLLAEVAKDNASRLESYNKLRKVIGTVESYYVDEVEIQEIVDKAIEGMLENLDAHSSFLSDKKYDDLKVQTDGEFGGLGITVGMRDGALTVIAPIEGTPADKAGLKPGDIILKVGDQSTLNMTIDEAVSVMRGKPKTKVSLTIVRKKEPKPLIIEVIRDIITVKSVYSKRVVDEDILYIRVTSFDKNVVTRVKEEIKDSKEWMSGIILDLRNNPGGLLDQAVGLSDLFIDSGVIVSQKGRIESENREFKATSAGTYNNIPLVVLVNNGSASASEIVSGALQDHKKAVVIGENTFGKGSVQVILPLDDGEALRLTIARYYLPSGRTIQAVGIKPDIVVFPGEVPHEIDEFKIKEAELKSHLENELEKIEPKIEELKSEIEDDGSKTIVEDDILRDIQLKSAVDTLKTWKIIKK